MKLVILSLLSLVALAIAQRDSNGNPILVNLGTPREIFDPEIFATSDPPIQANKPPAIGSCGGKLTGSTGTIASPEYPQNYPSNTTCSWKIEVAEGKLIKMKFIYIDIEVGPPECPFDGIIITDYGTIELPDNIPRLAGSISPGVSSEISIPPTVIGDSRFCGTDNFPSMTSVSNTVFVEFYSDLDSNGGGFVMEWETVDTPVDEYDCNFEDGFCPGWVNINTNEDNFDWKIGQGTTLIPGTGPYTDHTTKTTEGKYAFVQAMSQNPNDTAVLSTPEVLFEKDEESMCLEFWSHMYGEDINTLAVGVAVMDERKLKWVQSGNQGEEWKKDFVEFKKEARPFRIMFVGIRGAGISGDIAIDDVKLHRKSSCSEIGASEVNGRNLIDEEIGEETTAAILPPDIETTFAPELTTYYEYETTAADLTTDFDTTVFETTPAFETTQSPTWAVTDYITDFVTTGMPEVETTQFETTPQPDEETTVFVTTESMDETTAYETTESPTTFIGETTVFVEETTVFVDETTAAATEVATTAFPELSVTDFEVPDFSTIMTNPKDKVSPSIKLTTSRTTTSKSTTEIPAETTQSEDTTVDESTTNMWVWVTVPEEGILIEKEDATSPRPAFKTTVVPRTEKPTTQRSTITERIISSTSLATTPGTTTSVPDVTKTADLSTSSMSTSPKSTSFIPTHSVLTTRPKPLSTTSATDISTTTSTVSSTTVVVETTSSAQVQCTSIWLTLFSLVVTYFLNKAAS